MHFRCVFTLLLCCVLVGLDWAEHAFKFACDMFMHTLVASWHLNVNPFHPRTFFVSGHLLLLLLLTPLHLTNSSVMRRPNRTSRRTFHNEAFIRNSKSFCQIFLTLTYPLSSTVGVRSHYVASQSRALPWSYKNSNPICTDLIILYPSLSLAFRVYAL